MNTSHQEPKNPSITEIGNVESMNLSRLFDGRQMFVFTSPKHTSSSLSKMEIFFLKEELTDVVLCAGKRRIPAHRLVLSAGSEYFATMFRSNLKEASQDEIELHDIDGDILWALIHYCYTGIIEIFEDTAEAVLVSAHLFQLTEVVEACCTFFKDLLHPSNCIGIGLFADAHGCLNLVKHCQNYTAEHFLEVIKNEEFLMLPPEEVAKLLDSDDLNVPSEEPIFHALMSWVQHDLPKRTEHVSKLLSLVRLPLLSPYFIVDHIETNSLFRDNPDCYNLIIEAFKYLLLPERHSMLQTPRTYPRKNTVGMYVLGGEGNQNNVLCTERYDVRLNRWSDYDYIHIKRLQCGVTLVDGKLYIVGGRSNLKTFKTVECYDVKMKTVTNLSPMLTQRHGLGVGFLKGSLYAIGGYDGWSYLNTVERWNPLTNAWSYVKCMSSQRSTLGVAVLNGKLYAVGGRGGSSCLSSMECYDPYTDEWTHCASMSKKRGGVGVGVLNGYLYAIGGHRVAGSNDPATKFRCVERYDPREDAWTKVASLMCERDFIGVCVLGERLFAVGGYNGYRCLDAVEAYDPKKNKWEQMASLTQKRGGASVIAIRGVLVSEVHRSVH